MYYRKYFEGAVEAGTATTVYKAFRDKQGASSTTLSTTSNAKRNKVLGDAIVSTLKDCGLTGAYYDETCSYVYFDYQNSDFGLYVLIDNTNIKIFAGYYASTLTTEVIQTATSNGFTAASTSTPFEQSSYLLASNYKFYVTVKGDTDGGFVLSIGSYSSPAATTINASIYKGVDKRSNKDLWGFYLNAQFGTSIFWLYVDSLIGVIGTTMPSTFTPAAKLTMNNEWVVLIEMYMTVGYVVMKNCYLDPGFSSNNTFYEIDGDIYYCSTPYLFKCVTPVSESE